MHLADGRPVLSASDLVGFLACGHLTQLELSVLRGEVVRPTREDPELDVLTRRGDQHERRHLDDLVAAGRPVVEIVAPAGTDVASLWAADRNTLAAMASGVEVIYQAAFFDGVWRGQADFLYRVERPSALGLWSYEPVDTKLARKVKASAVLQLCSYADHIERLQGCPPQSIHVVGGDGTATALRLADFAAYYRRAKSRLEEEVAAGTSRPSYPDPVVHCGVCRWSEVCQDRRRADDHLSLVAGMRRSHTARLMAVGVGTLEALATAPVEAPSVRITPTTLERLGRQARLQLHQRTTGTRVHELVEPVESGRGLNLLPAPSPGDLFFDIEGDPFAGESGLEYLFGLAPVAGGSGAYRALWGHDAAGEKRAFEAFVDLVMAGLAADPAMHVYHYGSYEKSALTKLMSRHATREDEVDRLLRGGVLIDLYRVVQQGVRVSEDSYSLKSVEHFYLPPRTGVVADGRSSIVAYEAWLDSGDQSLLDGIEAYNRDDCESTQALRWWLEERRNESAAAGQVVNRPDERDGDPSAAQEQADAQANALVARLTASLPDDPEDRSENQSARWLLAQLVSWHRREARPEWWAWFHRLEMSDDDLLADAEALAGLEYLGPVGSIRRSIIHRYRFPVDQEHKMAPGKEPVDPRTGRSCGVIHAIDTAAGLVDLLRGRASLVAHPAALVPTKPLATTVLRDAIARLATRVAEGGLEALAPGPAAVDLLTRRAPRLSGGATLATLRQVVGTDDLALARTVAGALDHSCVAVQGPPGSGKTYTGARMILALVAAGKRVGITANSHKAICRMLDELHAAAAESGRPLRIAQKATEAEWCGIEGVERVDDNARIRARLALGDVDVVAGTAWLFAAEAMEGGLDALFVDEAGQFSLANAVAAAAAATNLVLLGDPCQLAQPAKGVHPPGAGTSVLEHLLDGRATLPTERGLFLATTWRLHPDLCAVVSDAFYEGRLQSHPSCSGQSVDPGEWAGGTGLAFRPVESTGNRTTSPEEAAEVLAGFTSLVGRGWTDQRGQRRRLGVEDILVVAPYNAQVAHLQSRLPPGARVGTVDKFQGQEAAVVLFSMTTSSAADLSRSLRFLYSANRLNVAVSRARALAVVIASPELLSARCATVEQLRLVSALCSLAERGQGEDRPLLAAAGA